MEKINLEINNNTKNDLVTEKEQKSFLETNLGKTVNFAIDVGLRAVLPNFLEDSVIQIKDTLFKEGLSEGIKSVIDSSIDFGKSVVGVFTGKFENIDQMQNAVRKGGIIDGTSDLIDKVLSNVQKKGLLSKSVVSTIKQGKNILLDNVLQNIESTLTNQIKEIENVQKYSNKWKEYYEKKDFNNMEKQFKKLENSLQNVMPLEETIRQAREIENVHNLIKNNGQNFNITYEEKELAKKFA